MYCMLFVCNYWLKHGVTAYNIVPENKKNIRLLYINKGFYHDNIEGGRQSTGI